MEERRQFVRLDVRLPITYRQLPSAASRPAGTKNVGGGGICLFLDEPLAPGTPLAVDIVLPGRQQPVTFDAEIVWCERYEVIGKGLRQQAVEAGVKFVRIDDHDQQAILQYVILSLQPRASA